MADLKVRKFASFIAYIAVMICAIALVLGKFIPKLYVLIDIAYLIAIIVAAISAFFYARAKRNPAFMIAYIVALVVILIVQGFIWFKW